MSAAELLATALGQLAAHKLRTALTMLGMMFGVGAVIAMLAIGAGAERQALAQIDRLGTRNLVLRGAALKPDELADVRKRSLGLSPRDLDALGDDIALAAPRAEVDTYQVVAGGIRTQARAFGVTARQPEVAPLPLAEGRFFTDTEERHYAQVCVLGAGVRTALFGRGRALGADVKVDDLWCEVVGVLAPDPDVAAPIADAAIASTDAEIYLPLATALAKLDRDPLAAPYTDVTLKLADGADAAATAARVDALLAKLHAGARDYTVVVPAALLAHSRQTRALFDLVMGIIAGISLVVGGVGIVNVMLASVYEQTREIGVRRALGARRADIRRQFLVTAFALAGLGGLAGVGLGLAAAHVVAAAAHWPTVVTLGSLALSLGVAVAVGLAAGGYPAARAARLDPIAALAQGGV